MNINTQVPDEGTEAKTPTQEELKKSLDDITEPVFDEQNNQVGCKVFVKNDEAMILFSDLIHVMPPDQNSESERAQINGALVAALTMRMASDQEWLNDLMSWFGQKINTSTNSQ